MNQSSIFDQRSYTNRIRAKQAIPQRNQTAVSFGTNALGVNGNEVLLFIFLRGGMDGMSFCVPYGDPDYAGHRPTQALPSPGASGGVHNLDGFFGLHPRAGSLMTAYNQGKLAMVQTVGSTDPSQSHFDAMKFIESGYPNQTIPSSGLNTGWLGRHMTVTPSPANIRGIVLEPTITHTAAGAPQTLPIYDPARFSISGHQSTLTARRGLLGLLYEHTIPVMASAASSTLSAIDELGAIDFDGYTPANGAVYPSGSDFGERMQRAAALIKADIGVEMIEIDRGGWDDHSDMGAITGGFADRVGDLADVLAAFYADLGTTMNRVTVVAMSEFGRRVTENGSFGTDHGRGGCMFLMGGSVNGGQVFHDWQGLTPADLDEDNLPVRLDYRDVLGEVLEKRMGNTNLAPVFPGHTFQFPNIVT